MHQLRKKKRWNDESPRLGMLPNDSKSHIHRIYGTFNSQLIKRRRNGQLVKVEHFSVSKVNKSSLKDYCGENMGVDTNMSFYRTWFELHSRQELLTGDSYTKHNKLGKYLEKKVPFFSKYNRIFSKIRQSCFATIGGMSKYYKKEDPLDLMLVENWTRRYCDEDDFRKYNGAVLSFWDRFLMNDATVKDELQNWINCYLRCNPIV